VPSSALAPASGHGVTAAGTSPWTLGIPPAPQRRRRRRPPWWLTGTSAVVVVVLAAGLLAWHPWNPPPAPPATLHATSDATSSVQISWPAAAKGAPKPDHYLVFRDGIRDGTVPAATTSWTDQGLKADSTHTYTVEASGSGGTSGPSPAATIETLGPGPVGLSAGQVTYTTVEFSWKPSPQAPAPTQYEVYNGLDRIATLPGTDTTYIDKSQGQGSIYQYSVVALWGTHRSVASKYLDGSTLVAPLALPGMTANVTLTSAPAGSTGNPTVGQVYVETWDFTPQCAVDSCSIDAMLALPATNGTFATVPVMLHASASASSVAGKATVQLTHCSSITSNDTVIVSIRPAKGASLSAVNGGWTQWTGTVDVTAPYAQVSGGYYCPRQTWHYSVTGQP